MASSADDTLMFAKIAVHAPPDYAVNRKEYMYQFLELLGMDRERVIFVKEAVGAHITGVA